MIEKPENILFVEVILPIYLDRPYTYSVPEELADIIVIGMRVEVQFGKKKIYSGIVVGVSHIEPEYSVKPILSIIDPLPIIWDWQYTFWKWMANYYCSTIGEVMNAALPAHYKLSSETVFIFNRIEEDILEELNDDEYLIYQSLNHKKELSIKDVENVLERKNIYPVIHSLFKKGVLFVNEDLHEKYSPKVVHYVVLAEYFKTDSNRVTEAFDLITKSEHQTNALLAFISLSTTNKKVSRKKLMQQANVSHGVIRAMANKGIFEIQEQAINRFGDIDIQLPTPEINLSPNQSKALKEVSTGLEKSSPVLLYGVTSSGKTLLYISLIEQAIERGEQVLYLLPEIALSVQVINKLRAHFGQQVLVSHSRLNNNERVDLWKKISQGASIVIGVRSSVFLPFKQLGLIIVDEEHDPSFKQFDPAPRYQARDVAIYLSRLLKAKILLGTATPSLESWHNVQQGKYTLVKMMERYQSIEMPEIELVDLRYEANKAEKQISNLLGEAIQSTLNQDEQVIIFKNRRGYAPTLRCTKCQWTSMCKNCDISLTFHKYRNSLQCHLCGYKTFLPQLCPACGHEELLLEGFGTQKIEDELEVVHPKAKVGRMDFDTTRKKDSHEKIIAAFEDKEIDILVGTQMVTKGLDFDHVGLVGVVHGDQQLFFPDFRAIERTYQLLVQVSGRAGRKFKRGKVLIQTYYPDHPIFADIKQSDFESFYARESAERQKFKYPPFYRLIKLTIKHPKQDTARLAVHELNKMLRKKLGDRILGPSEPSVNKVRGKFVFDLGLKLEKDNKLIYQIKDYLKWSIQHVKKTPGLSNIQIRIDVDP